MTIWTGFIAIFGSRPINRERCDGWRSRREGLPARPDLWAYPRSMTGFANRPWSIAWNRSEKVFDPSSFGYRKGRKPADALGKIWREVGAGSEWIVDADLKDYFGSVDHEKLMTLIGKQVADGRVLNLVQQMLKAGYEEKGQRYETPRGTPQGGVLAENLSGFLTRLRSSADTLDVQERQRIVRLVVRDILVGDETIVIRHSIPLSSMTPSGDGGVQSKSAAPPAPGGRSYLLRSGSNVAASGECLAR
jgi:Reverse transcriptase (RNA-dependent DNA polymerase)